MNTLPTALSIVRYIGGRWVEIRFARDDDRRVEWWWLVGCGSICLSDADYDEITEAVRDEIGARQRHWLDQLAARRAAAATVVTCGGDAA